MTELQLQSDGKKVAILGADYQELFWLEKEAGAKHQVFIVPLDNTAHHCFWPPCKKKKTIITKISRNDARHILPFAYTQIFKIEEHEMALTIPHCGAI